MDSSIKPNFSTINYTLIGLVILNSIIEILAADQASYNIGAPGSIQPNILAVGITFFLTRYIMKRILKIAPNLKFKIPITIVVWYVSVLLKFLLIGPFLLDQPSFIDGSAAAIAVGVATLLIGVIWDYVDRNKNEESTSVVNKSLAYDQSSFLDYANHKWNQISDIFISKPSDNISKAFENVIINYPLDENGDIDIDALDSWEREPESISFIQFKKHYKGVYNFLDEQCGYKDFTWRSAFKAHIVMWNGYVLTGGMTKKEEKKYWKNMDKELNEINLSISDYEELIERIQNYTDTNQLSYDLWANYYGGWFTTHKFL